MSSQNMIQAFLCTPVAGRIETTETARGANPIKKTITLGSILTVSLVSQTYAQGWETVDEFIAPTGTEFGETVAISQDGRTALVAAAKEDCAEGRDCGAVHVFVRGAKGWHKQAKLTASDEKADAQFGGFPSADNTLALSADGDTALVATNPFSLERALSISSTARGTSGMNDKS